MNRNNRKKPANSERSRKSRRKWLARLRVFALLIVLAGSVYGLFSLGGNSVSELIIDKTRYSQLNVALEETTVESQTNVSGTEEEIIAPDNEVISAMASVPNPQLKSSYPIEGEINSSYAIVYDVQSDEVLFAKNAEEKCYPASTTKILTAALVLEYADANMQFTAGDELDLVSPESSLANLNNGSMLDLEMMIDALMLPSGNDAAYCAAANIGRVIADNENLNADKAVKYFVAQMNERLKGIGAENSHFENPDGFHDDNHYTTAMDMLKISLYATQFEGVRNSAAKPSRNVTFLSGEQIYWENSNKLIHEYSDCYYMYANGLKTGMTDQAGYCVVATANRFGHDIVVVVLGGPASDKRWNDTLWLLDQAFSVIRENN